MVVGAGWGVEVVHLCVRNLVDVRRICGRCCFFCLFVRLVVGLCLLFDACCLLLLVVVV